MSRPLSILGLAERAWTVLSFLAIVTQLIVIRGFERGVFYLFVVPPLLAMFLSSKSVHARGRFLAKLFLILVSCGLLLAWFPRMSRPERRCPSTTAGPKSRSDVVRNCVNRLRHVHCSDPCVSV